MSPRLEGFHCVGWVKSAHGISGEVFLQLYAGQADWTDTAKSLYLMPKGKSARDALLEFKEFKIKAHKGGLILRSPSIKDRTQAETFKGALVYLHEDALVAEEGDNIFLHQLAGFNVVGSKNELLGRVEDFSSNGPQDLLVVRTGKQKTALVPLVEAFIVEIDFDREFIRMDLPPGLIDMEEEEE